MYRLARIDQFFTTSSFYPFVNEFLDSRNQQSHSCRKIEVIDTGGGNDQNLQ
jgi:hypothetical protein